MIHARPGRRQAAALAAALVLVAAGCGDASNEPSPPTMSASADRQEEVAERGASVMPFDLERTTHRFAKTDSGGVQTVVADDPGDATQIRLIREHLRLEADEFRQGRFTDPARIHGQQMPGLADLRDSTGRIDVTYADTTDGARITYSTTEAQLVTALHAWFDAQVSDHGGHATAEPTPSS
jgi:hypothetical protein